MWRLHYAGCWRFLRRGDVVDLAYRRALNGDFKDHVMAVANGPGEQIFPGELAKALGILAAGGEIDYVGASAVELVGAGESAGNYRQMAVEDGTLVTVRFR